jgi:hypothetical protein
MALDVSQRLAKKLRAAGFRNSHDARQRRFHSSRERGPHRNSYRDASLRLHSFQLRFAGRRKRIETYYYSTESAALAANIIGRSLPVQRQIIAAFAARLTLSCADANPGRARGMRVSD